MKLSPYLIMMIRRESKKVENKEKKIEEMLRSVLVVGRWWTSAVDQVHTSKDIFKDAQYRFLANISKILFVKF